MPRVSLIWVLLLVAIAALVGYWARNEQTAATASAQHAAELTAQLQASDLRIKGLDHRVAQAESARAKAEAKVGADSAATNSPTDPRGKQVHLRDFVRDHPEFEAARMAILRHDALRQYSDRLASLHLPAEQLARLKDLLVERSLSYGDAAEAARAAGLADGSPAYNKATSGAQAEVDTEIASLIGKDTEKQLIGGSQYKYQVDNLNVQLAGTGSQLTPDQSQALETLMYQVNQGNKTSRTASFYQPDPATGLTGADQQLIDQAGAVVSPPQVQALRDALIAAKQQQQMMNSIFKQLPPGSSIMDD